MRILSALDAVSPAIARTRLVLFSPFRMGRTWKLSVCSYLAFAGTLFLPFPLLYLVMLPAAAMHSRFAAAALIVASLTATVLYTGVFYLCSRMHFVFFDLVLNRGQFVAPVWRRYGQPSRSWTWVKIGIGCVMAILIAAPAALYIRHLIPLLQQMKTLAPGQPLPPELMFAFFAGYGSILLIGGAFFLAVATLDSFIVPSMAIENTPLREAFRRFFAFARREPGQLAAYVGVKIGLGLAGYMALAIGFEIALLILAIPVGLLVVIVGFLLHFLGVSTGILLALGILAAAIFYLFMIGYALPIFIGPLFTFMQAYTLYFLGGRYPQLGALLDASTPPVPPPTAYPYGYAGFAHPPAIGFQEPPR